MDLEQPTSFTIAQIQEVAQEIVTYCDTKSKIICFHGAMGAGKTTLIKAIVQELGGKDQVNSPTFGLVNEYHFEDETMLGFHFDCYRLENELEALDMGIEEYVEAPVWIFIEWPEKIASFIPQNAVHLKLTSYNETTRIVQITPSGF